jgi:hypothetical protein
VIPRNQDQDYSNTRSVIHPSFTQILPFDLTLRPRTLVYVSRSFIPTVALSSDTSDPDLLVIDITEGKSKIQLLNIYHEANQLGSGLKTIKRTLYTRELQPNTLLIGNFNTYHP